MMIQKSLQWKAYNARNIYSNKEYFENEYLGAFMKDQKTEWLLNQDWNNDQDIKASQIAEAMYKIYKIRNEQPENSVNENYFHRVCKIVKSLSSLREQELNEQFIILQKKEDIAYEKAAIRNKEDALKKPLQELLNTDLDLFEQVLASKTDKEANEEMIPLQLAEYYHYFENNDSSKKVTTGAEAYTIARFIRAYTTERILDQMDMKDTSHHSRDQKTNKYKDHSDFKNKKSEKECWDDISNSIFETLFSGGTGKNRAKRLSTYTVKIIKEINAKL